MKLPARSDVPAKGPGVPQPDPPSKWRKLAKSRGLKVFLIGAGGFLVLAAVSSELVGSLVAGTVAWILSKKPSNNK